MNTQKFATEEYSFSKLASFSKCPFKYFLRYVLGRREHVPAQVVGRAIHIGQEVDNNAKVEGKHLHVGAVLEAAVEGLRVESQKEDLAIAIDPFVKEHERQLQIYEESGNRGLIRPVKGSIEAPFRIMLEVAAVPAEILGFVDVVSEDPERGQRTIVDYKSGVKAVSQYDVDGSMQFQLYALGAPADQAQVVNFVRAGRQKPTTKVTKPTLATEKRQTKLLVWLGETIKSIRRCVRTGDWPHCDPGAFYCGGCDFYQTCYGVERQEVDKTIKVLEVKGVGTVPQPEWRKR